MFKNGVMKMCGLLTVIMLGTSGLTNAQSVSPPGGSSYNAWKNYMSNYKRGGRYSKPVPMREKKPDFTKNIGKSFAPSSKVSRNNKNSKPTQITGNTRNNSKNRVALNNKKTSPKTVIATAPVKEQVPFSELTWFPNKDKRTGIFAPRSPQVSALGYNQENPVSKSSGMMKPVVSNMQRSNSRKGCLPTVEFRYSDKGFVVTHTNNPAASYTGRNQFKAAHPGSFVNAYTAAKRVQARAHRVGKGCNAKIIANWNWLDPMEIVMRPPNGQSACAYRRTLEHEKEHIAIYQNTPKEYEARIKRELAVSRNPEADYRNIYREITADMQRRNANLDSSHFSKIQRSSCRYK